MLLRRLSRRAAERMRAELGEGSIVAIDEWANSFGVESRGVFQLRGNGCLAATDDELRFLMWWPHREIRIPRDRITGVARARSHLGKTVGSELLRVRFTNDQGLDDSVAFRVRDLGMWEALLQP